MVALTGFTVSTCRPAGTGPVGQVITGPTGRPPAPVYCSGGYVHPLPYTNCMNGYGMAGPLQKLLPPVLNSNYLQLGSRVAGVNDVSQRVHVVGCLN